MPQQETFFTQTIGPETVAVLKTYDSGFAREAFDTMDARSQEHLRRSLKVEETYEEDCIPQAQSSEYADFLWEELLEAAREDGSLRSFFVVVKRHGSSSETLYVSPDWPSAEDFAKKVLSAIH
jgi:hypothetical protein